MRVKPIETESSLEFVVVGPLGRSEDGILVKSSTVSIDLIGAANLIYNDKAIRTNKMIDLEEIVNHHWSRSFTVSNRKAKFLFCYRKPNSKSSNFGEYRVRSIPTTQKNEINNEFNRFVENSIVEFKKMIYDEDKELLFKSGVNEEKVIWNISPLILACTLE